MLALASSAQGADVMHDYPFCLAPISRPLMNVKYFF